MKSYKDFIIYFFPYRILHPIKKGINKGRLINIMAGFLPTILALVVIYLAVTMLLGVAGGLVAIIFSAGVLLLLKYFNVLRVVPVSKKMALYGGIALVFLGAFMSGWLVSFGLSPALLAGVVSTATIPGVPAAAPTVTSTACAAGISPEILGTSATVTPNAYDLESNTPYSSAVGISADYFTTDGQLASATGFKVGDMAVIYPSPNNASYYGERKEVCITGQQQAVQLSIHNITANTNLQTTGYDKTGSAGLSAGTNAEEEDYDITLGANQDEKFYLEVLTNVAVNSFNLAGAAMFANKDIDDCYPVDGQGFTKVSTPKYLKGIAVANSSGGEPVTKDYTVWKLDTPILLSEWEFKKFGFVISSGATDPTTNTDFATSDMCGLVWLDATWARGADGRMYNDIYTHDSAENNVGMVGNYTEITGKQDGVVIEGI